MYFIGVDLGTTGVRSAIVNENLEVAGEAYIAYPLIHAGENQIEQDALIWWGCVKKVVNESINNSGIDKEEIKSLSISSQGISFVPIDRDANPLRNAITWLDTRAQKQKNEISQTMPDEKFFSITSKKAGPGSVIAKILWIRENEPEIYARTYKLLTAHDYIVYKMCSTAVTDHTLASGMQLYDLAKGEWSEEILDAFDIGIDLLPDIRKSGSRVGTICEKAALELGLGSDVEVAVGGQDQKCAALGTGLKQNIATVSLGTAAAITSECSEPVIDESIMIPCHPYLVEGKWVLEGVVNNACSSLNWLKDTFFSENSYDSLNEMAERIYNETNGVFFYPHLSGSGTPYLNKGINGYIYGITLATGKEELIKSVYEGVAYQIKTNIMILEKVSGMLDEVRIFGGGSKSDIWCQIIADITGKKIVRMSTAETACIGACILAGMAVGTYESPYDAAKKIKTKDYFMPNEQMKSKYEKTYKKYIDIEKNLDSFSKEKSK